MIIPTFVYINLSLLIFHLIINPDEDGPREGLFFSPLK